MIQKNNFSPYLFMVAVIFLCLFSVNSFASTQQLTQTEKTIELSDNREFTYQHFSAKKHSATTNTVALWILPGYPNEQRFYEFSQRLSDKGIEIWLVNILDNLFIPKGVNATRQLSGNNVAELIKRIHQKTGKNVLLIAESYGAIPVLRGAHQWQKSQPEKRYLTGAVLFSPNLFKAIPSLGKKPEFIDIAAYSTIPILIYQSQKSSTRGQFKELLSILQNNNASVFSAMLKNTIALFYTEDKTPETLHYLKTLPSKIVSSLKLLESSPLPLFSKKIQPTADYKTTQLDSSLTKYQAKNSPLKINLKDINQKDFIKSNYKNKVTIINFWATWCKPCLEEIPSLNRLQVKMKNKPFEIISINYAERPNVIKKFMESVIIDFPVLIDESGEQAVKWHVFAFPSTFVIGPDGQFHYGVNAGILWDTPEVIDSLNALYSL